MKSSPRIRLLPPLLLVASLVLCSFIPVWGADYNSLVNQAREQLQNEQFVEALATAKDAVRANANDYKGHYYIAMAYMGMGRFDDAEAATKRALQLAPANARPGVEKLSDVIKTRRQGAGSVQAAETALAEGLVGKAARLYEQAWDAGQENPELGLKAADLYANRLNQPVDAGRVLRQVSNAAKGSPAANRADAELKKLAGTLRELAQGHVSAAMGIPCDKALLNLQEAEKADPSYLKIYEVRAWCAAYGDIEGFQNAIKELARHNHVQPDELANLPKMAQWLQQPTFRAFLTDLLGSNGPNAIETVIEKRKAEADAVAERAAKKAEEARLQEERERERQEQAKRDAPRIAAEKEAAQRAAAIAAEQQEKQYRQNSGEVNKTCRKLNGNNSLEGTTSLPFLPLATLSDLTDRKGLFAYTDPAIFGNPDSMLAKATRLQGARDHDAVLVAKR